MIAKKALFLLVLLFSLTLVSLVLQIHADSFSEVHLDFGTNISPVQSGFTGLGLANGYNDTVGYGWMTAANVSNNMAAVDRGVIGGDSYSDLHRDFHWAGPCTRFFLINLNSTTTYTWTWHYGDLSYGGGPFDLWVQDVEINTSLTYTAGQFFNITGSASGTASSYFNITVVISGNSAFEGVELVVSGTTSSSTSTATTTYTTFTSTSTSALTTLTTTTTSSDVCLTSQDTQTTSFDLFALSQSFMVNQSVTSSAIQARVYIATHWGDQNATFYLTASSGGIPVGPVYGQVVQNISNSFSGWLNVTFPQTITLTVGLSYNLVLMGPAGIKWYLNDTNPYADGVASYATDNVTWTLRPTWDYEFEIWSMSTVITLTSTTSTIMTSTITTTVYSTSTSTSGTTTITSTSTITSGSSTITTLVTSTSTISTNYGPGTPPISGTFYISPVWLFIGKVGDILGCLGAIAVLYSRTKTIKSGLKGFIIVLLIALIFFVIWYIMTALEVYT